MGKKPDFLVGFSQWNRRPISCVPAAPGSSRPDGKGRCETENSQGFLMCEVRGRVPGDS